MPNDFIAIDKSTVTATHAVKLQAFRDVLRDAYERGKEVKSIMDHMTDGSVWTTIEDKFGIATGSGQTVYNYVTGAMAALDGTQQTADGKNFTERVGG